MAVGELKDKIESLAKKNNPKIAICEGWDERGLKAAANVLSKGLGKPILIGDKDLIKKNATEFGVDISGMKMIDPATELKDELAEKLFEARKHKRITIEEAKEMIVDVNYFGCVYALAGHADCVVGSTIASTAAFMRPALQTLRKKDRIVSEVSVANYKDKVFFMSDFSLNIAPDKEQLAVIGMNSVECAKELGFDPKVAFLSFSTKGSGGINPDILAIRDAVEERA